MKPLAAALVMACAALPAAAAGPGVSVSASVNARTIGEDESVTLSIQVRGTSIPAVEEPDLSSLADFTIASGPNESTSTSMVWAGGGAQVTEVKEYSYVLLPKHKGTLTIPAFTVRAGAGTYKTNALQVQVTDASQAPRRPARPSAPNPLGNFFGQQPQQPRQRQPAAGDIFLETDVDKDQAYVGEQILVTYKLFTQVDLAGLPQPKDLPSFTGFWVEEIPVDPRSTLQRVTRRGREYLEVTLMKKALFPTRSGELPIEETVFEVPVQVRTNDPFDSFFNRAQAVYKRSPAKTIKVLPLPQKGRPDSFRGAVGDFKMSVTADRHEAQVNEAVGLTVSVEGDGNLKSLGNPVLPDLPEYRLYDPKIEDKTSVEGGRVHGKRTWSYVLIPLSPGDRSIPPVKFSYFDPSAGRYRELQGSTIKVAVNRAAGAGSGEAEPATVARHDVVAMRRDIRYIKPVTSLGEGHDWLRRGPWFYGLLALPLLLNAGLYVHVRRREQMSANVGLFRMRGAARAARRRLKAARLLASKGDAEAFYAELDRAVTGYLADKFNVSAMGLTRDRIEEMLAERKTDAALCRQVAEALEACDYGRFAPGGSEKGRLESLLGKAQGLLTRLERRLG